MMQYGTTALMSAASIEIPIAVSRLIEVGANLEATDKVGKCRVWCVAECGAAGGTRTIPSAVVLTLIAVCRLSLPPFLSLSHLIFSLSGACRRLERRP